jgi:hypothetical protein
LTLHSLPQGSCFFLVFFFELHTLTHTAWLPLPCLRAEFAGPRTSISWPRLRISLICSLMARTSAGPVSQAWAIPSTCFVFVFYILRVELSQFVMT